jgi:serine/threonine protein kinase/WD40 repeat protein
MQDDRLHRIRDQIRKDREAGLEISLQKYLEAFPGEDTRIVQACAEALDVTGFTSTASDEDSIGPYKTLKELGRGGQGIVYLAEDTRLHRKVALKILTGLGPDSERQIKRFRREAEVASRLEDPGICTVHDSGIVDGVPFIAMQFIDGRTLTQFIAESHRSVHSSNPEDAVYLDLDEEASEPTEASSETRSRVTDLPGVLRIFERAARTLHVAHEAGIVHRDIKPGNIMITDQDRPILLDFGLAGSDDANGESLTISGDLFGTPAYMSPEQLVAQRIPLDRRTDVWSLGVCLHEALTNTRPFEGSTRHALYQAILTKDPSTLVRRGSTLGADLKVVLSTALEKDRDRRYSTALEFADELRRVRKFEPVRARPIGVALRVRRWSQRNPAVASAALITFLGLVAGLVLALIMLDRVEDARADAVEQGRLADQRRVLAERSRREAQESLAAAFLEKAARAIDDGRFGAAAVFASAALREDPEAPGKAASRSGQGRLSRPVMERIARAYSLRHEALGSMRFHFVRTLEPGPTGPGLRMWYDVEIHPSGGRVSALSFRTPEHDPVRARWPSGLVIWDVSAPDRPFHPEVPTPLSDHAWSPDGDLLVTVTMEGKVTLWQATTYHRVAEFAVDPPAPGAAVLALTVCPRSSRLAIGWSSGHVQLHSLTRKEHLTTYRPSSSPVENVVWMPDGNRLVTASLDDRVTVWNLLANRADMERDMGKRMVGGGLAVSDDGSVLAVASLDGDVWILSPSDGAVVTRVSVDDTPEEAVFGPEPTQLLVSTISGRSFLYHVPSRDSRKGVLPVPNVVETIDGPPGCARALAWSRDGRSVVTGGTGSALRLYRFGGSNDLVLRVGPEDSEFWSFDVTRDGAVLIHQEAGVSDLWVRGDQGYVRDPEHRLFAEERGIAILSPDERWLLRVSRRGRARLESYPSGELAAVLSEDQGRDPGNYGLPHAFAADSSRVFFGLRDGRIKSTALPEVRQLPDLVGHSASVSGLGVSADGGTLASGDRSGEIRLWDVATGRSTTLPRDHDGLVSGLAFTPDGHWLATSGRDRGNPRIRIWNLAERRVVRRLEGHRIWVNRVCFTPDGKLLISAADDNTVRLWRVGTGELLQVFRCRTQAVDIHVVKDGRYFWVNDGAYVTRHAIRLEDRSRDPNDLVRRAEAALGMRLEGLKLIARENPGQKQ